MEFVLSWLEQGADKTMGIGLFPLWAIHLRVGLYDSDGSLPTQKTLIHHTTFIHINKTTQPNQKFPLQKSTASSQHRTKPDNLHPIHPFCHRYYYNKNSP